MASTKQYKCQTCGTQIKNINGPLKEIEEKIKQNQSMIEPLATELQEVTK